MRTLFALFFFAAGLYANAAQPLPGTVFDLDGNPRHPLLPAGKLASVLIFFWHDCPICNSYIPEINRICATQTNFDFYVVQVDPDLTPSAAKNHARDYDVRPPVLLDPRHHLVKLAKATVTPEAVIFGMDKKVLYRGRIDDLYAALGKKRASATEHNLREALETISAGKRLKKKETKAIGCLIQTTTH
jgi:hypothetical protein